ncbi:tetratricopeptide repeat protein [Streptomyces sp. NPDC001288]|uniref:tetratricopeptide repeat protein n=1 Tax=Streptomyces sp. NPDC001297 TaxID=3364559 RepID=UPI003673D1B5
MFRRRLADRLANALASSALSSKKQLADLAGVSRTSLYSALNPEGPLPSEHTVAVLARELRLPFDELLTLRRTAAKAISARNASRVPTACVEGPEGALESGAFASLRALAALPRPAETFVGREEEMRTLLAQLTPSAKDERQPARAQMLVGMGGVGKTELVLQIADRVLAEPGWCPGGVLYADLNGYDRVAAQQAVATDVLDTFLRALGVAREAVPPGVAARSALLRTLLVQRTADGLRSLLVLDNAGSESQVRPLLPSDGATPVLVTSRTTLAIGARVHELGSLTPTASLELLRATLRQAFGDEDTRVDDEIDAARAMTELCGGLPLALHIVSGLLVDTARRPLSALAAALQDARTRLDRLSHADHTVTAAFELSYRALTADQAKLFRLLSLNPGPELSTAAVTSLLDATDAYDVERALQDLVRAHLAQPSTVWGRWRMHDLLRLYAEEHGIACAAEDGRDAARERLMGHYLHTTRAAVAQLPQQLAPTTAGFANRQQAMAWLETERANLVAASLSAPQDSAAYGYLALALGAFFDRGRHYDDWITTGTQAVAAFRARGAVLQEAQALNFTGLALRQAGDVPQAVANHERALELFRQADDRHGQAQALNNLGLCHQQSHQASLALREHREAAAMYEEAGDIRGRAQAFNNLGLAQSRTRDFHQALATYERARALFTEAGDRYGDAQVLNNVGSCHREMREPAKAVTAHRAAAALYGELGDIHAEAGAWLNAGLALNTSGRPEEAQLALERALDGYSSVGDARGTADALNGLGSALLTQGQTQEALQAHASALTVFVDLGDQAGQATTQSLQGLAQKNGEDRAGMLDSFRAAADLFHQLGDRAGETAARAELSLDRMARGVRDFSGFEGA